MKVPIIGSKDRKLTEREKLDRYFRHAISELNQEVNTLKAMMTGEQFFNSGLVTLVCKKLKIEPKDLAEAILDNMENSSFIMNVNTELDIMQKEEERKNEELKKLNPENTDQNEAIRG